jgi:Zn-dependent peptidase ImmA (M78 family)
MEEIAHCFLGHVPSSLVAGGDGRYRDFDKAQETEAFGVGAAVLLPWTLFFHRVNGGVLADEIAEEFDVSSALVRYRISICGATPLYRSRTRKR